MDQNFSIKRLGDLPETMAALHGEREAIVFQDRRYSFTEVSNAVNNLAKGLMAHGVGPGDHVCMWLNNSAILKNQC